MWYLRWIVFLYFICLESSEKKGGRIRKYRLWYLKIILFDYKIFILIRFFSSIQGLGTYVSLATCLPGFSLALLYMTVLSFDSVTRGKYFKKKFNKTF
jgi:hypothetical protein